jgi:hypothetical protein
MMKWSQSVYKLLRQKMYLRLISHSDGIVRRGRRRDRDLSN